MTYNRWHTYDERYAALSDIHRPIIDVLQELFLSYDEVQRAIKRDCLHFSFPNGMWCYIAVKSQAFPVLGLSRGAWMVQQDPWLACLFDEVKKVVAKIVLHSVEDVEKKGIEALLHRVASAPENIGVKQ